jgi:hypothetical protein
LYDLGNDLSAAHDLAAQEHDRVSSMRSALAAWRTSVNAQTNRPNPNFDAEKFKALYRDVDPTRFDPAGADQTQWEKIWAWRKLMDAVVPKKEKGKP